MNGNWKKQEKTEIYKIKGAGVPAPFIYQISIF